MKKITSLGYVIFFAALSSMSFGQTVLINEFVASNSSVNTDEDGDYSDWVELYNNNSASVNLEGFGLSDNASNPFKWTFPNIEIEPGGHLLVWCSDKNRANPGQPLHTNWKISADGESLVLTFPDGSVSDQLPPIALNTDVSYGRSESGAATFSYFTVPTPGLANAAVNSDPPTVPIFSAPSGIYADSFNLQLTHPDPSVSIIYTLDGSEPKLENIGGHTYLYKNQYRESPGDPDGPLLEGNMETFSYSNAINVHDRNSEPNDVSGISTTFNQTATYLPGYSVPKSTVVRACAVKNGVLSATVTANYFIGFDASPSLPIVSINANEEDLFDYYSGIHVSGEIFDQWRDAYPDDSAFGSANNFTQSGDEWEIKANLSLLDNSNQVLNQDIGLRINGGFSRVYPNKSLRLYARQEYGSANFSYPIFGNSYPFSSFKRLLLRNAGNDAVWAYIRDAFMQRSVQHLHVAHQPYRPAIAFVNGEYWGLLDFRERYDDKYFERVFNIDPDDLDFLEFNGDLIQEGENGHYLSLISFLQSQTLESDLDFNYVNTQMDVENFTDFFIANIYVANTDWPHNNIEFWRKRNNNYEPGAPYGQDGRWRWVLKDMDFGFGYGATGMAAHNTLAFASSVGGDPFLNPEWSTLILRRLLENAHYKTYFINRFADLINTTYLPERLNGILSDMAQTIAPEIPRHGQRWATFSLEGWQQNVAVLENFSNERPAYQRQHIQQKFGIESQLGVSLDVNDISMGYVKINTIEILPTTPGVNANAYPWNGVYFKDVPVTITAIPVPGFEFSHWSGASSSPNPEIVLTPQGDISLVAHFVPENSAEETLISYWLLTTALPFFPLQEIASSFEIEQEGKLKFESCYDGYPFVFGHPLWRKAALEKTNSQTDVNYQPEANDEIPFEQAFNMRGLTVKSPFKAADKDVAVIWEQSTAGFEQISGKLAVKATASGPTGVIVDYSIAEGDPVWTSEHLPQTNFEISSDYGLITIDFTSIYLADNNPNFKMRVRFDGPNLEADNASEVLFNNISISGKPSLSATSSEFANVLLYPNPTRAILYVKHDFEMLNYSLHSADGRKLRSGKVLRSEVDLSGLESGMYLIRLTTGSSQKTYKILKN